MEDIRLRGGDMLEDKIEQRGLLEILQEAHRKD